MRPEIRQRSQSLLKDARLQHNLTAALGHTRQRRAELISENPDWQACRQRAADSRQRSLNQTEDLLAQASSALRANGAHVHLARDAAHACEIAAAILREADAHQVIKGKSMVSEEIGLNDFLQAQGIEVWEADLGELIVQLRGEAPAHITAPALHLDRSQIAQLFRKKMTAPVLQAALDNAGDDPTRLTAVARQFLRDKFLQADAGITGANFVVAETGTLVLVENESNIRLATSLPRLHIAITGIERLVPNADALADLLTLLPVSATGQIISSAVSLLSGPRRVDELDGPEALHVIFVDNGRQALRADPLLRPALQCIRCGACLNVCPVFRRLGGHGYGSVYPGPIGTVLSGALLKTQDQGAHAFACTLCGACDADCPVQVPLSSMILSLRQRAQVRGPASVEQLGHKAYGWLLQHPRAFSVATDLVARLGQLWPSAWSISLSGAWNDGRALPYPSHNPSHNPNLSPCDNSHKPPSQKAAAKSSAVATQPQAQDLSPLTQQSLIAALGEKPWIQAKAAAKTAAQFTDKAARLGFEFTRNDTAYRFCPDDPSAQAWLDHQRLLKAHDLELSPGFELFAELRAEAAIARTGSLIFTGRQAALWGQARHDSLTARHLLVRLNQRDIYQDLKDFFAHHQALEGFAKLGSYVVLLSGPSRTADIEKILVMPAHGPASVHVAVIE